LSAGVAASDGVVLRLGLMGGAKNLLIGNVIKSQFLNIRDWPFGAATSITLTLVMGLLLLVYWRASRLLTRRWSWNDRSTAARRFYDRHLRVPLYSHHHSDCELV
jgi:hypothetical protein